MFQVFDLPGSKSLIVTTPLLGTTVVPRAVWHGGWSTCRYSAMRITRSDSSASLQRFCRDKYGKQQICIREEVRSSTMGGLSRPAHFQFSDSASGEEGTKVNFRRKLEHCRTLLFLLLVEMKQSAKFDGPLYAVPWNQTCKHISWKQRKISSKRPT